MCVLDAINILGAFCSCYTVISAVSQTQLICFTMLAIC